MDRFYEIMHLKLQSCIKLLEICTGVMENERLSLSLATVTFSVSLTTSKGFR